MKEVWKDVVGYEGLYEVSDLGNVRSTKRGNLKNLYLKSHNRGYLQVELFKDGKSKMLMVHRIVAQAFIKNADGFPQVNHKDENKTNNRVDNLEWCTGSYNICAYYKNHPDFFKNRKSVQKRKRRIGKAINQYTLDGDFVASWSDSREVEIQNKWSAWSIQECCRGNRKKAYGYTWQYAK